MAVSAKRGSRKTEDATPKKRAAKDGATKKGASKKKALPVPAPEIAPAGAQVLDRLFETVQSRRGTDPALSHSARLLSRGRKKIAQKFGEEAVECLIEAVAGKPGELVSESADVLYHLIVMWVDAGITPEEVWSELRRRQSMSGVQEKASRNPEGSV
ncbi:phosphoribosyl-ATP diphosphatase [Swaminathania salitolerans]|uniref:Phosphoribosyl-ATP pyrophosphatase n=1 Tax=Swaminathania salitolerans TaxID=182838 RepID=A0A511BNH7_9PROT|nr:phosphoribosyl-ATP diphosphatase [Swaminathania salitolerans]GBQ14811.1 phosphoribosyl ATP pyrophosphatase [Swaminathania salitolerans LMG 21291]GEL01896.1 hypothetical protein SSA02_10590 [Swaminathania salitolerans]